MVHTDVDKKQKKLGVCLNLYSDNRMLLEAAKEVVVRDGCSWCAIYIENENDTLDPLARQRLEQSTDDAREAGAEIVCLPSISTVQGIITAAELHKITHVIVGKRRKSRIASLINPTLASRLLKHDAPFELQVVILESFDNETEQLPVFKKWRSYIASIMLVLVLTAIVEIIQESLPEYKFNASIYNVSMVYLLAIVFCSLRFGLGQAIVAGILSFGLYNYFFILPFYEFGLGQVSDVINFTLFLSASLIFATVADAYKRNMGLLRERELAARALHDLSKDIAGSGNQDEVANSLAKHLGEILQSDVVLLLYHEGLDIVFPDNAMLSQDSIMSSQSTYNKQSRTYADGWVFFPVSTPRRKIGVVGIRENGQRHSEKLIEALCYQAALAIERTHLMQESEDIKLQHQRESLRSALLSSVSHDLKTPLVSIIGSLSSIRHMDSSFSVEERQELIGTAIEEAERLNQSITNILDMTRIEAGELQPEKDWVSIYSLFADSVQRQRTLLEKYCVILPEVLTSQSVYVDPVLFPQVIQNLLENAAKYTPEGSEITLSAYTENDNTILCISDNGPGIPMIERDRVFDKFTRIEKRDAGIAGTGLGLAICKAIVEVHDGSIVLDDNPDGAGLVVTITLAGSQIIEQE